VYEQCEWKEKKKFAGAGPGRGAREAERLAPAEAALMFNPTRDQAREFLFDLWAKHRRARR
jgi:hypothetical protein